VVRIIAISLSLISTLIFSHLSFALDNLSATVDKNPAMINESIVLTVIANDSVDRDALDTSTLLKDFIVGRTSISSQTSFVNFKASRTTQWQIVLIPKKTGNIIIPAFNIDNIQSNEIMLNVMDERSPQANKQQDIFITSELSSNDVYVQQLLTLTVKLYIGVQLQRGSLTEPNLVNANIEQIGKDQETDSIVNGKRYRVIERTYAITPQQSGQFTLVAPMFSGEVMLQSQRRSNFLSFNETKPVSILGEKLELTVNSIPENYPSDLSPWLPSELLTLHQEWQPTADQFMVGDPITRTITLTAVGLSKEQLPKIVMTVPTGLKVYPDQAQIHANLTKERLISQKIQNFALVASKAGQFTLPEISITWWNTVTNRYQQATLPSQIITIMPNDEDISQTNVQSLPIQKNEITSLQPEENKPIQTNINTNSAQEPQSNSNLTWLFLALWLLTIIAWISHTFWLKRNKNTTKINVKKVNDHYLVLLAACKKSEAEQTLTLLLPWIKSLSLFDKITVTNLNQALIKINNDEFSAEVNNLQECLYGKNAQNEFKWQGDYLIKAIQHLNKKSASDSTLKQNININP